MNLVVGGKYCAQTLHPLPCPFPDLVSEYQQYQEATIDDDVEGLPENLEENHDVDEAAA